MPVSTKFVAMILCGAVATSLSGEVVEEFELGEGAYTSTAIFQFTNQNQYIFTINYDDSPTGEDIVEFIAESQPGYFIPTIESYDFGGFLYGLTIGEDSDEGYGTPDEYLDYWHYWTKESETDAWTSSMIGFSDRIFTDGSVDGWVFNSNNAPIPAPPVIFGAAAWGMIRRRRG